MGSTLGHGRPAGTTWTGRRATANIGIHPVRVEGPVGAGNGAVEIAIERELA